MKPRLTLLTLLLFLGTLSAQVRFKVKLLPDNQTYQVLFRPDVTITGANATTFGGAQVVMRVPVGGFNPGNLTNLKGTWTMNPIINGPVESPGYSYIIVGLDNAIPGGSGASQINYTKGVEIPVFSFRNNGTCTGIVEVINNATDPFNIEPNSATVPAYNTLFIANGIPGGIEAYSGNYSQYAADCRATNDNNSCYEVYDVALNPPTTCTVADGSITFSATSNSGPLRYSINFGSPGVTWQASPTFTGLAAGTTYYLAVTDALFNCPDDALYLGPFQLPAPLTAVIIDVQLSQPNCGASNGSIAINALSVDGGTLNYSMSPNGPWQASSTFSNLAEGTYTLYVRNISSQCTSLVGTYTLTGCEPQNCDATFDLVHLGNGKYEVTMTTDTSMGAPWNLVSGLQVTMRMPTGGFQVSNVTSQLTGAGFISQPTVVAPPENPGFDYITISLDPAPATIPFVAGGTVHLFTFDNTGSCVGDSIRLMPLDDPASGNATFTLSSFLSSPGFPSGAEICFGTAAEICVLAPPPAPDCDISLDISHLGGGIYGVTMTPDTTFTAPWNSFPGMNITVRTATGGFVVSNIESQIPGATFSSSSVVSPPENSGFDYFSFGLESAASVPYTAGQPVLLFTFENTGNCVGDSIGFMPSNDPVLNNTNFNLPQQITVAGLLGDASLCFGIATVECDSINNNPCSGTLPDFTPLQGCEGALINFNDATITNGTITSWSWNFGDGSAAVSGQNPNHTYSSSGNFEVSLTVTTQEGCDTTFMEFVTVFPSPGDAPVSNYDICNGVGVTIETPDNITSAVWSPTTGLDLTDPFNPVANPAVTTTYTLTATNSFGCVNTSQVTVTVVAKPVLSDVTVTGITDCNLSNGSIAVSASGTAGVEYGLDSGSGIVWQSASSFGNLAAGTYLVYVRNADDSCPVAYSNNPIVIAALLPPSIVSVSQVQPVGCNNNGSITINASGGLAPLQYSITGGAPFQASNVFSNLGAGTYNLVVRNSDGTCAQTAGPFTFTQPAPPTIPTGIPDTTICIGSTINLSVALSTAITSYTINGNASYPGAAINGSTLTFPVTAVAGNTNYTVILNNASNCSATETFRLSGVATPTSSFTVSPVICTNGNVVLNFTGTALPTTNLNWNLAGAQIVSASQQSGNTPANATMVVRWTSPGTKTVTLTVSNGGGCTASSNQGINVSSFNPNATFAVTNASCGLNNGAINMTVTGTGFNYNWSNSDTTEDISSLVAGNYFVTITDPTSSCQASANATVGSSPALNISNVSMVPATQCVGGNGDGSITVQVSGGTPNYTFALTGQNPVNVAMTSVTFNNLTSGPYTVTVTDDAGCTDVETVTLTALTSQVSVSVTTVNAACTSNNGNLTATPTGGTAPYTYTLIKNNVTVSSNQNVTGSSVTLTGLEPAVYLLIFQDANGCIAAGTGAVGREQGTFTATETITPASCGSNNGAILLSNLPVGSTLAWSVGGSANPLTGLAAGVYTATITESTGCTSSKAFFVQTSGGQTVVVTPNVNASCGLANGSVLYTVTGGGAFSYTVLGANVPSGFGTPGILDTIFGLKEGAYVLEVTDLTNGNCKVFQVFTVSGSVGLQTNSTAQLATGCGNFDAEISLTVTGGQTPYTIVSNAGNPANCGTNTFCVTGLYEGIVEIEVSDANGCMATVTQDLGDVPEPSIDPGDIQVTNAVCPGGFGSIISLSNTPYQVLDADTKALLAGTPWNSAPMGDFILVLKDGACTDSAYFVVNGPADWNIASTVVNQNCAAMGSIVLNISGGTLPYDSIVWSNGIDGASINGLQAGTYTVTVTDSEGCTETESITVIDDCLSVDCDTVEEVFYLDTFIVELLAPLTEICLPTELTNFDDYTLELNGGLYDRNIGDCGSKTTFYDGFDDLPTPGPYTLQSWEYGGTTALTNFEFDDVFELLGKMKELDGLGNWVYLNGRVIGGIDGVNYGDMYIREATTGIITEIPAADLIVPHPTVLIDNDRFAHLLIAIDPVNGCADSLYINVIQPETPTVDSIEVVVAVGETQEVCIPVDELVGVIETLTNLYPSFTENAQILSTGDVCVEVVGLEEGPDQAVIVICDDLGMCDTTILNITVTNSNTELEIMTGFSPNGDGVNDIFKIRNIQRYPENDILIINRWGKTVYQAKGYNSEWGGVYRSKNLPDGTYFYILNVVVNGEKKEYKGYVEMKR
ncbi:MAG: gliding motility-associated C-terminal domain-containing protein [Saprospiraceae bacterium]|nr:gliding motility-associated C-terminal domain-containing protein [Saprospiraceae bacterium]